MAGPVMRPTPINVEDYLAGIAHADRRADAHALVELMTEVTGEPGVMWGPSIVGFGSYRYRYASGREGDAPLAGFSPRKAQLVVYLTAGFANRDAEVVDLLGPHTTGVSCLYLKRLAAVDLAVLRTLVERSVRAGRGGS